MNEVAPGRPIKVFYSYAHEDAPYREEIAKHLAPLKLAKLITDWHDRRILSGSEWDDTIDKHLESADVILLLVSADFLNSGYVQQKELPRALRKHLAREAIVIPIIVKTCLWNVTELGKLQAAPTNGRPMAKWDDINEACTAVAQCVYDAILSLHNSLGDTDRQTEKNQAPQTLRELLSEYGRHWNLPHSRNRFFTGRDTLLLRLETALEEKTSVVLFGPGGVGKSEIASEYAHLHREKYRLVWWIRAENRETILEDYVALADVLKLPEARQPEFQALWLALRRWFSENSEWLLILDNAKSQDSIDKLLPESGHGHVLITSRWREWQAPLSALQVNTWSREDAVRFLLTRTGDDDREAADAIAARCTDLPLALAQVAAKLERARAA